MFSGHHTTLNANESGFSQWLNTRDIKKDPEFSNNTKNVKDRNVKVTDEGNLELSNIKQNDKKHCSSLQNIQTDLNNILDKLQNMVANDCLLEGN